MSPQNKKFIGPIIFVVLLVALSVVMSKMSEVVPTDGQKKEPPMSTLQPTITVATNDWSDIISHTVSAPPRGSAHAPFTIVEFGDFQCPQCGKERVPLEKLVASSNGNINLYFLQRPFPQIHQFAMASGQAALEAADEGKFWPMYDELYSHQTDLEPGYYSNYAAAIKADPARVSAAASKDSPYAVKLGKSMAFCDDINVQVTPTLIVHDNKAGKVIAIVSGKDQIDKLFKDQPWAVQTASASTK